MLLPRRLRKIIALFRGQASPLLVGLAIGLGFWFGLMPGFTGLHAVMLLCLVLVNLPTGLFLLSAGLGKSVSLAAAPLLYHAGGFLLDHAPWLVGLLSKIPIVGLSDFRVIALSGAIVSGPLVGIALGFAAGRAVLVFRRTWLGLEENSEKFARWQSRRWVRILDRIVVGRHAENARAGLNAKTVWLRKAGVVLTAVVLLLCLTVMIFARDEVLRRKAVAELTRTNGAQVDIAALELSPLAGSVAVTGLGMTDRDDPTRNKIQVASLAVRASLYNLSVGKIVMDHVQVSDVRFDQQRETPGQVVSSTEQTAAAVPGERFNPADYGLKGSDFGSLERYFRDAGKTREWLGKIRRWLPESGQARQVKPAASPHRYLDYLSARTAVAPTVRFLARRITAEKVDLPIGQFGPSTIIMTNISDAPMIAALPVVIDIQSQAGGAHVTVTGHFDSTDSPGRVSGSFEGIDLGRMQSAMNDDNAMIFDAGRASGTFSGHVTAKTIDITIDASIKGLNADTGGKGIFGLDAKSTAEVMAALNELDVRVQIVGPITAPRIVFDSKSLQRAFQDKLVEAGKQRLADELNRQIQKELGDKIPEELKGIVRPEDIDAVVESLIDLFDKKKRNR